MWAYIIFYIVHNFQVIYKTETFVPALLPFFFFLQKVKNTGATFNHVDENHSQEEGRIKQWKLLGP